MRYGFYPDVELRLGYDGYQSNEGGDDGGGNTRVGFKFHVLDDEDCFTFPDPISTAKWVEVTNGTDRAYEAAKRYDINLAFGTDLLGDPSLAPRQGKFLAKLTRWFTPYEALKIATHDNAELLAMSGPRNPYQEGALGVIMEGAYADLILVNGNPLQDLDLVADPDKNFVLIMKDGAIYKNTLE